MTQTSNESRDLYNTFKLLKMLTQCKSINKLHFYTHACNLARIQKNTDLIYIRFLSMSEFILH